MDHALWIMDYLQLIALIFYRLFDLEQIMLFFKYLNVKTKI